MKYPVDPPLKQQICERLKQARQAHGFNTAKAFALSNGLKISTYSLHEAGTRAMSFEIIEHYCKLLAINPKWLLTGQEPDVRSQRREVPIIEWCDILLFPDKVDLSQVLWTSSDAELNLPSFSLRVKDDAMEPRYPKDTLLLVDLSQRPQDRDFALFVLEDKTVCFKQLAQIKEEWFMRSLNPDYPSFKVTPAVTILGKVVQAKFNC